MPLISVSRAWCLQVPASYKRHFLMGLPLFCWTAAPHTRCYHRRHHRRQPPTPLPPPHPDPGHHTHPQPVLGPWLTHPAEGSGLGQQTPSQMEDCPEELMPERHKRPRDPSDVPQIFQRGRGCSVYRIFNSRREGVMHGWRMTKEQNSV